jgi:hypothetical protein
VRRLETLAGAARREHLRDILSKEQQSTAQNS